MKLLSTIALFVALGSTVDLGKPNDGLTIEYLLISAHEQAEVSGIELQAGMDVDVVVTSEESPVECSLIDDRSNAVIASAKSDGPRCTIFKYKPMSQLRARVKVDNVGDQRSHVTVVVRQ